MMKIIIFQKYKAANKIKNGMRIDQEVGQNELIVELKITSPSGVKPFLSE